MSIKSIFLTGTFLRGKLEFSYKSAFEAIGVRTFTFDESHFRGQLNWLLRNRVTRRLTKQNKFVRERASRRFNRSLEHAVLQSNAPALLVGKGELVMEETLHNLRRRGVRVACYFPDNPFPPHLYNFAEALPAARETDLYLIWSKRLVTALSNAGVRNPVFLPFAWDPDVFPYQESQPQGVWPGVLFLGGWDRERAGFLEEVASQLPLRIFGPSSWARAGSRVRHCWQGSDLRGAAAASMIRESAISLNVLRTQHVIDGFPDGLIMRHFEVPGAGGFLLSTRGGGATELFPEGESGEYFSSVSECVDKARHYIADDSARRELAEKAHVIVASEHQYTDRARQILRLLDECR